MATEKPHPPSVPPAPEEWFISGRVGRPVRAVAAPPKRYARPRKKRRCSVCGALVYPPCKFCKTRRGEPIAKPIDPQGDDSPVYVQYLAAATFTRADVFLHLGVKELPPTPSRHHPKPPYQPNTIQVILACVRIRRRGFWGVVSLYQGKPAAAAILRPSVKADLPSSQTRRKDEQWYPPWSANRLAHRYAWEQNSDLLPFCADWRHGVTADNRPT